MTLPQIFAFALVAGTMVMFVSGRIRYDLVAVLSLLAGIALGIVSAKDAFSGFSDDIVIIVGSALVISAAISKSGIADTVVRRVARHLARPATQVAAFAGTVMGLSALVKNIGALSMLMPPALQIARKTGTPPSSLLMPMSFASLLGGLVTLVGTSPNIIVSRIREEIVGQPFRMFDFTPVGLPIALAGLIFLVFGYRLLPGGRRGAASIDAAFNIQGYTMEVVVPEGAPVAGMPAAEALTYGGGDVHIGALIRDTHKRYRDPTTRIVRPGDHLILEGEPDDLEAFVARAGLKLARADTVPEAATPDDEIGVMEAVVNAGSLMIGWSPSQLRLYERFAINVLAVSRSGERVGVRLKSFRLRAGDVLVIQGNLKVLPEILGEIGCLPLAARDVAIGRRRNWLPAAILAVAMAAMAVKLVPVTVAFFGAAVLMVVVRSLAMREAYEALDAPVLITLACLIPVSDAMRTTGATDLISGWLSAATSGLPVMAALGLVMATSMAITPFLNNAATVLVAGPIAAGLAKNLGYQPEPFLMAIAVGAACDFLTPIGHQCNMLVMGPGGYRFGDYWRLGLPLSILVLALGVPLIAWVWPVTG